MRSVDPYATSALVVMGMAVVYAMALVCGRGPARLNPDQETADPWPWTEQTWTRP